MRSKPKAVNLPAPTLQIEFSICLAAARKAYLIDALSDAVATLDIRALDAQLSEYVPRKYMGRIAAAGLRAELIFPVPIILQANPRLLAYYRLLLGISQKAFYTNSTGAARYKRMEDAGIIPAGADIKALSMELVRCLAELISGIGMRRVTRDLLDDLTLLTLGPQLRGGVNVKKGSVSIQAVFELVHTIVKPALSSATEKSIEVRNAAGRKVLIEFSADPDIVIREVIGKKDFRNIIAIEIKGGTDYSNIHNRIGEAEKSHQKARQKGYVECWTIVNVERFDSAMASRESPSTNRFYRLSEIVDGRTTEFSDFRSRIIALTGISDKKGG
jgi:hypothetical protein